MDTSIAKYGVHCVVGNVLDTRYTRVTVTTHGETRVLERKSQEDGDIESTLTAELTCLHSVHINTLVGDDVRRK